MDLERFFLVVPPGLEQLAASELNEKIPGLEGCEIEHGGVSFSAPLEVGLATNRVLKIPAAVLLRIAHFKARDLPKLYQKVSNIKWGRYLVGSEFELSVASSKSRLLHEKKIEKAVREGIERHFVKQPPKKVAKPYALEVQVRFYDDHCTISLDLSGEPLFKRGYKTLEAIAPLRENLAAALFYALWRELGGFSTLVDPMCGSGTFLFEAATFWQPSRYRDFAFQKHEGWMAADIQFSNDAPKPIELLGFDQNAVPLQNIQLTLKALREGMSEENILVAPRVAVRDIFGAEPIEMPKTPFAFICNPPYGERIRLPRPPQEYYLELLRRLLNFSPRGAGIVLPARFSRLVPQRISGYTMQSEISFQNGGLPVVFRMYRGSVS